jgi:pilus assembly protein CpaB
MHRRILGITAAVLLAALGTFVLVQYVRGAEDRALAGEELANVYVITSAVPAGTAAEALPAHVRLEQVPVKVRSADAVTNLGSLKGQVAAIDLVPGEQLLTGRMVKPEDRPIGVTSQVPPGHVEVTVELDPIRAMGGRVRAGDTVAVLASFDPFDLQGAVLEVDGGEAQQVQVSGKTPNTTHLIVHEVVVTSVQTAATAAAEEKKTADAIPEGKLLVTLAVSPADAERVVFTAEFGKLWLAGEGDGVVTDGTRVQDRSSIYGETASVAR